MKAYLSVVVILCLENFVHSLNDAASINCPKFPEPKNGQMICNHNVGHFCTLSCNAGFTPESTPAKAYFCNTEAGRWVTYPGMYQLPWPNCVPRTNLRPFSVSTSGDGGDSVRATKPPSSGEQQMSLLDSALHILKSFRQNSPSETEKKHGGESVFGDAVTNYGPNTLPVASTSFKDGWTANNVYTANSDQHAETPKQIEGRQQKPNYDNLFKSQQSSSQNYPNSITGKIPNTKSQQLKYVDYFYNAPKSTTNSSMAYLKDNNNVHNEHVALNPGTLNQKPNYDYLLKKTEPPATVYQGDNKGYQSTLTDQIRGQSYKDNFLVPAKKEQPGSQTKASSSIPLNVGKNKKFVDGITLDIPSYAFAVGNNMSRNHSGDKEDSALSNKREIANNDNNNNNNKTTTRYEETKSYGDTNQNQTTRENSVMGKSQTSNNPHQQTTNRTGSEHNVETIPSNKTATAALLNNQTHTEQSTTSSNSTSQRLNNNTIPNVNSTIAPSASTNKPVNSASPTTAMSAENATTVTPISPVSPASSYASNVIQNNSDVLSYQVLEEHRNNRTHHSEIDMMNVKSSHFGNRQNEIDIENITIATTKADIPPSNNMNKAGHISSGDHVTDGESQQHNVDQESVLIRKSKNALTMIPQMSKGVESEHVSKFQPSESSKKMTTLSSGADIDFTMSPSTKTLVRIKINHAPLDENTPVQPEIKEIALNSDETKSLIEKLLASDKKVKSVKKGHMELDEPSETHTKTRHKASNQIVENDANSRTLDLNHLRKERKKEIDRVIQKYFKDVKLHSTDSAYHALPPVPVFSTKDLRLLREMVEARNNIKRSGLLNQASSLWERMLSLTAERNKHPATQNRRPKLPSNKKLAEGDSKLAKVIMKDINKVDKFHFKTQINPFLSLLQKKQRQSQQMNNHAVNYLKKTTTKDSSKIPAPQNHKLGSRRQYVWNGATFIPMEDRSHPSSYLNSDQGLSAHPSYKWNGASFITNSEELAPTAPQSNFPVQATVSMFNVPSSKPLSSDISNQEVQTILNMWNNNGPTISSGNSHADAEGRSLAEQPTSSSGAPTTIFVNGRRFVSADATTASPTEPIWEKDSNNEVLYYWNGYSYQPILKTDTLPPHTIKYKVTTHGYLITPDSYQYLPTELVSTPGASTMSAYSGYYGNNLNNNKNLYHNIPLPTMKRTDQTQPIQTIPPTPSPSNPPVANNNNGGVDTEAANRDLLKGGGFESNLEKILKAHYPPNERTSPSPSDVTQNTPTGNAQGVSTTVNPYLPASVNSKGKANASINPYLSSPQNENPITSVGEQRTNQKTDNSESTNKIQVTTNDLPKSGNPFREDAEDLEQVIANDLSIKEEIDALSRIFTSEADSKEDDGKPTSDLMRLQSQDVHQDPARNDASYNSALPSVGDTRNVLIPKPVQHIVGQQQEVSSLLKKELNEVDDNKEQGGEDAQVMQPALDAAELRNLKSKQEQIMDILKSVSPAGKVFGDPKELAAKLTNAYKATFSPLSKKHQTENIDGKGQPLSASSLSSRRTATGTIFPASPTKNVIAPQLGPNSALGGGSPSWMRKMSYGKQLNPDEIKDLLTLTRIAEQTAAKKHGVTYPTPSSTAAKKDIHARVRALLKKPRVRSLLRFLVHSRKSKDLLKYLRTSYKDTLNRTQNPNKRQELTDKYNKALKRLLELWSKRVIKPDLKPEARSLVIPKQYSKGNDNMHPLLRGR